MLQPGFYEQLINRLVQEGLAELNAERYQISTAPLDHAESAGILARYIEMVARAALASLPHEHALTQGVELCNQVITLLAQAADAPHLSAYWISNRAELLLALFETHNTPAALVRTQTPQPSRPVTSLARTSLFTGARKEPNMISEIKREIATSDRVDLLVSFIKWSGLRLMIDELRSLTERGQLRLITTSYMGATDIKAIDELLRLPNTSIRVSYDTHHTRLHAKAYIFHRNTGFSTAYIGSSNVSSAALSSGLEWNVKITEQDLPDTFAKVSGTFEGYWNDYAFVSYESTQRPILVRALQSERYEGSQTSHFSFDIRPYGFQHEILDKIAAERAIRGNFRNLIVAATGTGKTVISAFDYKRYQGAIPGRTPRLLFVAHREEILKQSLDCYRTVLRDQNFGELFVGGYVPSKLDHLFISIQTLNSRDLIGATTADFYDYIVIDEFHHAAALSYQKLLAYYQPTILLGLTATPERLDGKDITAYFGHHITAEIRLAQAIDRELLAPFHYFGVTDNVDLRSVRWQRGGYDVSALNNVYTGNRQRADLVVRSLQRYVTDMERIIGLGFCVSIAHAQFMAEYLRERGIPSLALHAGSPTTDRAEAKSRLTRGDLRFIFVVDLYNEGVDIPEINTILFLRPTESLTVFLQQLGRGLRLADGKECLTVLDFIGQSHMRCRFSEKFAALVTPSHATIEDEMRDGFQHVPRGSFIQLEKQAMSYVLDTVRTALRTRPAWVRDIASFAEDTDLELTLANFLHVHRLSLRELYRGQTAVSFARLCVRAGIRDEWDEPDEIVLTKSLLRISEINSRRWIGFLLHCLDAPAPVDVATLCDEEQQMLLMFHYTIWQQPLPACGFATLTDMLDTLHRNPVLRQEICDILRINLSAVDFVDAPVDLGFPCALDLHCSYSRDQVLTALGVYTLLAKPAMREGVKYLKHQKLDVFFITLNKSDKDYSPSTMYQDYAINDLLFHWQSQSTTSDESPTGQRYIHHKQSGGSIALFVRDSNKDNAGSLPYTYLGLADYVQHTGSRPMSITWRLHAPIPAAFLQIANQLVVS